MNRGSIVANVDSIVAVEPVVVVARMGFARKKLELSRLMSARSEVWLRTVGSFGQSIPNRSQSRSEIEIKSTQSRSRIDPEISNRYRAGSKNDTKVITFGIVLGSSSGSIFGIDLGSTLGRLYFDLGSTL